MKKRLLLLLCGVLVITVLVWSPSLEDATCKLCDYDLAIYYNAPSELILNDLSNYNRVILESHFYDSKMISYLNRKSVETYGYMSLVEINTNDIAFLNALEDQAYLREGTKKLTNISETAYYMDITNPQYQNMFLKALEQRIVDKGFQGVFLDTVDLLEQFPDRFEAHQLAYGNLLKEIKSRFPDLKIMQNRGFMSLENSHTFIDVLLWENFQASGHLEGCDYEWYMAQMALVNKYLADDFVVIAEVEAEKNVDFTKVKEEAEANGYIFQEVHTENYMTWEVVDPRYLLIKR